jgi:hypothetical protein
MTPTDDAAGLFDQILPHLRTFARDAVEVIEESPHEVTVRVGRHEGAIVTIRISDPMRPSFQVSYPQLVVKRDGSRHVTEQTGDGVLVQGLSWIVEQLLQHGVVKPEFE